ncbi:Yae1p [Sporobolomyces koalae]|uniref:Yae1p n=1 Tax=Sporobolomyces koalae TaxID=500713 RepID=UPI00317B6CB0
MTLDLAMNDYDPWHSEDEALESAPGTEQISTQEWDKLSSRYHDAGYRDGITNGKNSNLQLGFDQGFSLASSYARQVGQLRGVATTLLSILTTQSGSKHVPTLINAQDEGNTKDSIVSQLREVVNLLGKLERDQVLPVDQEALEHAKSHNNDSTAATGFSQEYVDKQEMNELGDMLNTLGHNATTRSRDHVAQLEECRTQVGIVLERMGLLEVLPPARS